MEKKIIMVIVAAMAIIASAYTVSSAADSFDRPGVQGLWNRGVIGSALCPKPGDRTPSKGCIADIRQRAPVV